MWQDQSDLEFSITYFPIDFYKGFLSIEHILLYRIFYVRIDVNSSFQMKAMDQQSTFKLFAFGITVDILGVREAEFVLNDIKSVGDLKGFLYQQYPALGELVSLKIAINDEYAADDDPIKVGDEVILIPPVSGG